MITESLGARVTQTLGDHAASPEPLASPEPAVSPEPAAAAAAPAPRVAGQLGLMIFDIGGPIALYYLLHGAGVSNLVALLAGAALPVPGALYKLLVKRRLDLVALAVVATIVLSVCLSLIAHSPRFVLAREGLITGLWGIWFVASIRARRPAAFVLARPLMEGRRAFTAGSWDSLWEAEPTFRRIWRISSVIWGGAMLADAVIRVAMSYALPVSVVPALGGALWPVTFLLIQVVTNVYYGRAGLFRILGARWLANAASR
jgi:hypothetical protein